MSCIIELENISHLSMWLAQLICQIRLLGEVSWV